MSQPPIDPDDIAVTLAVRKDLGPQHDEAVIAEFLDRVGGAIDQRVDERVKAAKLPALPADSASRAGGLGFLSLVLGVPVTAICLNSPDNPVVGLVATAIAWAGIAAVNVAHRR
jgi:hypothetical protein